MYKPSLDGIRAVCIVFTLCNHIHGAPAFINGGVGVDVFFALSGFLITYLLVNEETALGRIDLKSFYIRRFFRIAPLYYLTVLLYFLSSHALATYQPGHKSTAAFDNSLWWLLTFNKEYQSAAGDPGVFGHAWTLGIEEKFYIVWPLFVHWFGTRRNVLRAGAFSLLVVCVLWCLTSFSELALRGYAGLTFGSVVSIWIHRNQAVAKLFFEKRIASVALVGIVLAYAALLRNDTVWFNLLISLFGAILVGSLWCNGNQRIGSFLSLAPIAGVGKLTYAIYLTHVLVINVVVLLFRALNIPENFYVVFLAAYAGSILFASALHYLIERPLMRFGKRLASSRSAKRLLATNSP